MPGPAFSQFGFAFKISILAETTVLRHVRSFQTAAAFRFQRQSNPFAVLWKREFRLLSIPCILCTIITIYPVLRQRLSICTKLARTGQHGTKRPMRKRDLTGVPRDGGGRKATPRSFPCTSATRRKHGTKFFLFEDAFDLAYNLRWRCLRNL